MSGTCGVLRLALLTATLSSAQDNWQVTYTDVGADGYELVMEWDHNTTKSLVIESGVQNPGNQDGSKDAGYAQGVCNPDSNQLAPTDGKPYWHPRFYPREVPEEVTQKTGIQFASVDWQPCGHKDVVICHAESHYDFHLYYVPLSELRNYSCTDPNPTCHVGRQQLVDDGSSDAAFFKLMRGNMPVRFNDRNVDFCVDPTSGMPESGIHYGDKSETLYEWRTPVTIMGSYDCKLTFFEPMVSWKWIKGGTSSGPGRTPWPRWDSGDITYDEKTYRPLPTSWTVEVSPNCRDVPGGNDCHITITVRGQRCDGASGCGPLPQACAQQRSCLDSLLMGILPTTITTTSTMTVTSSTLTTTATTTTATTTTATTTTATTSITVTRSSLRLPPNAFGNAGGHFRSGARKVLMAVVGAGLLALA